MSTKEPATKGPTTVVAVDPDDRKGRLKNLGGSQSDHWNNTLALQAVQALWVKNSSPEEHDKQLSATVAALMGIAPKDELEGMMAAQLVAAHNAACYRRAMIGEQTFEGRRENLNLRLFTAQHPPETWWIYAQQLRQLVSAAYQAQSFAAIDFFGSLAREQRDLLGIFAQSYKRKAEVGLIALPLERQPHERAAYQMGDKRTDAGINQGHPEQKSGHRDCRVR
jgi:hypothetical protein